MNFTVLLLKPFLGTMRIVVREAITPSFLLRDFPRIAPLLRILYRTLYPLSDGVISPARKIIEEFRTLLAMDVSRHVWLPNPVDSEKIRSRPPASRQRGEISFVAA